MYNSDRCTLLKATNVDAAVIEKLALCFGSGHIIPPRILSSVLPLPPQLTNEQNSLRVHLKSPSRQSGEKNDQAL